MIVWMSEEPMSLNSNYIIKRATSVINGSFKSVEYKKDINTFEELEANSLELNDIAKCTLSLDRAIAVDPYEYNRHTGSFIVIDRYTNETVGAGMIVSSIIGYIKKEDINHFIFDNWNQKKKDINLVNNIIKFREKDVLFITMGKNIGFEQDGKGNDFIRPVIVLKKFSQFSFLGIPLTSKDKDGIFYQKVHFHKNRTSTAILSQIRMFDIKRAKYKMGTIKDNDMQQVKEKLKSLIF